VPAQSRKQKRSGCMRCKHDSYPKIEFVKFKNDTIHKRSSCQRCGKGVKYLSMNNEERMRAGKKPKGPPAKAPHINFYLTREWKKTRYEALNKHGRACLSCGASPPGVALHVDHIKPRSKYPELELDINNLQVLCEPCNIGKWTKENDHRTTTT